jgi:2-C-methyl-D-erythritol 4-phosphate cytidylyltransferase
MGGTDKLWIDLGGQPLLARTIAAIAALPCCTQVVVVGSAETLRRGQDLTGDPWSHVGRWVQGGATRQDSVYCGLEALDPCSLVLVHDGARPLVSHDVLQRGVEAALAHGAVVAAVPVTDTIKIVDAEERVTATPARGGLRAAQTPQIFAWQIIQDAYARVGAARADCTDDAGVVELAGYPVYTFLGDHQNLKVSTPADLAVLRALWAGRTAGTQA